MKRIFKKVSITFCILISLIVCSGFVGFNVVNREATATQHGYCGDGYFVNYDETELIECHGGENYIAMWIAKSQLIAKYDDGTEYGRYPIYVKKVNNKLYFSEWNQNKWIEAEDWAPYAVTFCQKVEEYVFANGDEEKFKK